MSLSLMVRQTLFTGALTVLAISFLLTDVSHAQSMSFSGDSSLAPDFLLDYTTRTDRYYQVWATDDLSQPWTLVKHIHFGVAGAYGWTDTGIMNLVEGRYYYRIAECSLTNPDDYDADGMDDVYELTYGVLDPMNGSDGSGDPDSDTLDNLSEYNLGTNPNNPDTDGDSIDDPIDPRPTIANEAPQIQSVDFASTANFHSEGSIDITISATDADGDSMFHQFAVDGTVVQAWQSPNQTTWQPGAGDIGQQPVLAEIRDDWNASSQQLASLHVFRTPPRP